MEMKRGVENGVEGLWEEGVPVGVHCGCHYWYGWGMLSLDVGFAEGCEIVDHKRLHACPSVWVDSPECPGRKCCPPPGTRLWHD